MSIFNKGEEIICVDATNSYGCLTKGKTYIALDHCCSNCCVDVGAGPHFWRVERFRRPECDEITTGHGVAIDA